MAVLEFVASGVIYMFYVARFTVGTEVFDALALNIESIKCLTNVLLMDKRHYLSSVYLCLL
jgi:hypothetical protein